jgi:hypothetical protein
MCFEPLLEKKISQREAAEQALLDGFSEADAWLHL